MAPLKLSMLFTFLSLLSTFLFIFTTAADPEYLQHVCSNTNFTSNSTYQTNLNSLLSSLASSANNSNGFHNTTSGQDPNRVYGLFLCRGDLTASTCQDCVTFATGEATQRCPVSKGITAWYDQCLLRYSDTYFFSTVNVTPTVALFNAKSIPNATGFNQILGGLMNITASQAVDSPDRFATREGSFNNQTIYCLAQCTPDLSSSDCNRCLRLSIENLPTGREGGRRLYPSCYTRYELYRFYGDNSTTTPGPAPIPALIRPKGNRKTLIIAIVTPIVVSVLLFIMVYCFLTRRARKKSSAMPRQDEIDGNDITSIESLQFDFETIEAATNKFSVNNKLGEGGFGEVYKGVLPNGREIAVKRLSRSSGQGAKEFKNEVVLVAKLQHRNLVRLLGFCLEGEEKILVYEFVPNKSLDYFLYDPGKQRQLGWSRRYKIIGGIARGILYLHQDSRLRIIHRDLKASNVLLDKDMNPKISDFGMARIFGVDQTQGNTSRIVGTYGYMSPEYAMHGQFSVKSDVYSFGVLILELVTGKKNSSFDQSNGVGDLLGYAWKHWRDGTPMQLLDPTLADSYSRNEVMRCIHVGLLCVQEDPAERPTMATVVLMFNSYSVTLPLPQQPAFFLGTRTELNMHITKGTDSDQSTSKSMPWSVDDASITELYPRDSLPRVNLFETIVLVDPNKLNTGESITMEDLDSLSL